MRSRDNHVNIVDMIDAEMITLALAVIVPLSMLIYSNSQITETRETLRAGSCRVRTHVQRDTVAQGRSEDHVLEHHK